MSKRKDRKRISERKLETKLARLLDDVLSRHSGGWTETFEEAGVLTGNHGVVLYLGNGQEFQLTVVEIAQM